MPGYYIHSCQKMRYKAFFRPQYILGEYRQTSRSIRASLMPDLDPESNSWDPLDGELSQKLDQRPYVSLSRDRSSTTAEDSKIDPDVNEEELSLFNIHMPGVLTLDEVKALDLDHWNLLYHGTFVHMIVRTRRPRLDLISSNACDRILSAGNPWPWTNRNR